MRGCAKGFTLVELLVVIAIIAVLASLLLPALAKAKSKARFVEELSAGKQLMIAAQLYAEDNYGAVFPGYVSAPEALDDRGQALHFPVNARYPWRIVPYLAGSMQLIYSGENRARLARLKGGNHAQYVYGVSVYPSLGINSFFLGGNQSDFPAADANAAFGNGTVVTKMHEVRNPSALMSFLSARSSSSGENAQGYYQVTPPYLLARRWAADYSSTLSPTEWGFVAPRLGGRAVGAMLDGHAAGFSKRDMQDMRRWCNTADRENSVLTPK
jgi:prepilin-type N-terminal cleavage/methylation domain-containing protein